MPLKPLILSIENTNVDKYIQIHPNRPENLARLRTGQVTKEEPTGTIIRLRVQPERVLKNRNVACAARLGGR